MEALMTGVAVAGYMSLEEAVDAIGRRLMPRIWLGQETGLLEADRHVAEKLEIAAAETGAVDTPLGRLNRAVNHLLRALAAGDVNAIAVDQHGHSREFPAALWGRPGIRAVFRPTELSDEFRVAVEGHRAGVGSRWVRVSRLDIDRMLTELAAGPEVTDVEAEFRAWLAANIVQPPHGRPVSKNDIWSQAQRLFASRLPYHTFERIWSATVPPAWRSERTGGAKPA
jgi:hypothetical protein